jgi:hypothetical protein
MFPVAMLVISLSSAPAPPVHENGIDSIEMPLRYLPNAQRLQSEARSLPIAKERTMQVDCLTIRDDGLDVDEWKGAWLN